jgi:glycosyltransferase involved in cell wall biosynthesis
MKVAIVYDRINKYGGAERILEALHEVWPEAPIFTAVYEPKHAAWAWGYDIRPSFLQLLPFFRSRHEYLPLLTQFAFDTFEFSGYDVVISVTSAEAKAVFTRPGQLHVCYCLTPTRYLWSGYEEYQKYPGLGLLSGLAKVVLRKTAPLLRNWDQVASSRPDYYIPISAEVARRVKKYYDRQPEAVIYPPVKTDEIIKQSEIQTDSRLFAPPGYYLLVSRLVGYKRVDVVIEAFNRLGKTLVIIGQGRDAARLQKLACHNIQFVPAYLTELELVNYYKHCRALVFVGREDFGLTAAEAQAAGVPVICFKESGMAETVLPGVTGLILTDQTPGAVEEAVFKLETMYFDPEKCRNNAKKYDIKIFKEHFVKKIEILYQRMKEENG